MGVEGFEVGVNDEGTEDKDEEDVEDVTIDSLSRRRVKIGKTSSIDL